MPAKQSDFGLCDFGWLRWMFLLALGCGAMPLCAGASGVPVVAFVVQANKGEAGEQGGAITDLLLPRLSADSRWSVVERTKLQELERELALSASGWVDSGAAVRQGRLLHADLVVVCRIKEVGDSAGVALCEVVDARRASRLGAETVALKVRPSGAWLRSPDARDLDAIQIAVEQLLVAASTKLEHDRGRPVIAPLMFSSLWHDIPAETVQKAFIEKLRAGAEAAGAVLFDVGSAVNAAQDEAFLNSAGMTTQAADLWEHTADIYVWGSVQILDETSLFSAATKVRLSVSAWTGTGDLRPIDQDGTWGQLGELLDVAVGHVLKCLENRTVPTSEARKRVVAELMGQFLVNPRGAALPLVDVLAFFLPDDRRIQEARVDCLLTVEANKGGPLDLTEERCRLLRTFWRFPDGNLDLGLIERQFGWTLRESPEMYDLIRHIALDLNDVPADELLTARPLLRRWLGALCSAKAVADARDTLEALCPVVRKIVTAQQDKGGDKILPYFERAVIGVFFNTADSAVVARGGDLLKGAGTSVTNIGGAGGSGVVRHFAEQIGNRVDCIQPTKLMAPSRGDDRQVGVGSMVVSTIASATTPEVVRWRRWLAKGGNPFLANSVGGCAFWDAVGVRHWDSVVAIIQAVLELDAVRQSGLVDWNAIAAPNSRQQAVGGVAVSAVLAAERYDLARQLLDRGVRIEPNVDISMFPASALGLAFKSADAGLVKAVLGQEPLLDIGELPLHSAVDLRDPDILRLLVGRFRKMATDHRPFKEMVDVSGAGHESALWRATKAGWLDGVGILLAAGANPDPVDPLGRTLRDDAVRFPEIAVLINRRPNSPDNQLAGAVAMAMVERGDSALDTFPLDAAVLRYHDLRGATVLHWACQRRREAFVLRLIAAGAPLNAENIKGCQPLHIAANEGLSGIVEALVTSGAPLNHPSVEGVTPLHLAALGGDLGSITSLLRAGADQSYRDGDGVCPLLVAANSPNALAALRVFVQTGASLQVEDHRRLGLLEHAVFSDDPDAIQFLLDHGVQWRRPWFSPAYHPLLAAVQAGKARSVRKLIELGMYDDRALAFAQAGEIRVLLEDAARQGGSRVVDDAELWPKICRDREHGVERAKEHLARGGNANYDGGRWSPLWLAIEERNIPVVRFLVQSGANRNWCPVGLEGSLISKKVIGRPAGLVSEQEAVDAACAELVEILVTREDAAVYEEVLSSVAQDTVKPRTVRALVVAGVSPKKAVEYIRQISWLSEEEKQARLRLLAP